MARDDFHYITFKILKYYYEVLKNKIVYNPDILKELLKGIDEMYLVEILKSLCDRGYLKGLKFKKVWGEDYILVNDLKNAKITMEGVEYLRDNSVMKKALEFAKNSGGLIGTIVNIR